MTLKIKHERFRVSTNLRNEPSNCVTDHIPLAGQAVGAHEVCSEGCGHGLSSPAL